MSSFDPSTYSVGTATKFYSPPIADYSPFITGNSSGGGFTVPTTAPLDFNWQIFDTAPLKGPSMNINVRTALVLGGHLAQVAHDNTIVWQSTKVYRTDCKARRVAEARRIKVIAKLFGE